MGASRKYGQYTFNIVSSDIKDEDMGVICFSCVFVNTVKHFLKDESNTPHRKDGFKIFRSKAKEKCIQ